MYCIKKVLVTWS